ncbi:hypothetical protein ACQP2U_24520 [Nocardia sp. CA-084685]|uniref:hypothetical protein n=1 Tax=Nocardia sp. CA-084685 TaxID=3239970 RepID=UPI003D95EF87
MGRITAVEGHSHTSLHAIGNGFAVQLTQAGAVLRGEHGHADAAACLPKRLQQSRSRAGVLRGEIDGQPVAEGITNPIPMPSSTIVAAAIP